MSATRTRPAIETAPVGPGSLLWVIAGDPRGLLPGTAAGLMQLMLPGLGAGVTDHSNFFDDPYDRIFRSIPFIWRSIFTEGTEGDASGRTIRDFHTAIKGVDHHGARYHALDPEIFWWAHATFTREFFRARRLFVPGRPSRSDDEQLYAETVTWYRRYGVSDRAVPPTLDDFEARFEDICAHELELTPAVSWVLDPATNPGPSRPPRLPGPLSAFDGVATSVTSDVLRVIVYGCLPDVVRRRFDFRWTDLDRARFAAVCAATGRRARRSGSASSSRSGRPAPRTSIHAIVAGWWSPDDATAGAQSSSSPGSPSSMSQRSLQSSHR